MYEPRFHLWTINILEKNREVLKKYIKNIIASGATLMVPSSKLPSSGGWYTQYEGSNSD